MIPTRSSDPRPAGLPGWTAPLPPPPDPPDGPRPATPPEATGAQADRGPWAAGSQLPPPPDAWTTGPPAAPGGPGAGLSLQHLLLGLGTALVAVATIVFTAVNWDRMGATVQALFLVAATVVAAIGAAASTRRRMPATAEALGIVALLLALADAHALRVGLFPGAPLRGYWAGALGIVSLGAWGFGTVTGIRSTRVVAAVLGQVPLCLALAAVQPVAAVAEAAILLQVLVVVLLVARSEGAVPTARLSAGVAAATQAVFVVLAAAIDAIVSTGADRRGPAAVLALAAIVPALVAWLAAGDDEVRSPALALATGLGLGSALAALWSVVPAGYGLPALGLVAALVVAAGVRVPARWGRPPAVVGAAVSGCAALPLLGALSTSLLAASEVLPRAWELSAGRQASSLVPIDGPDLVGGAVGLHLLGLAALLLAGASVLRRRTTVLLGGGLLLVAALVAPVVAPLSVAAAAGLALAAAVVLVAAALLGADRPGLLGGASAAALAPFALSLTWAAATAPLALGVLGVGVLLAVAVTVAARRAVDVVVATGASATVLVGASVLSALAVTAQGSGAGAAWAAAAGAAALVASAGTLLLGSEEPTTPVDRTVAGALEAAWWTVHALALVAVGSIGDVGAGRVVLAVGAVGFGLAAIVRADRRPLAWVAAAHGLVLVWLQLLVSEVVAPEPYTLPLAAVLLAAGLVGERQAADRGVALPSWTSMGPALVLTAAPTVFVAFAQPGLVRPLAALAVASVVLAAGALHGRRAPVDVGTAVVVLIGLRQLAPVVGELPNWATIGAAGALLLAVGATFEQRRRDVHEVHDRYRSLV